MLRIVLGCVVGMLSAAPAFAQAAPAAAPAQQPAAQQNPFVFPGDGGVILNFVKADKATDFESVLGKVKEGLAKSEKPERKQQATGWKVLKASEPGPNGAVIYAFIIEPAVKGADYSVGNILVETLGQTEGQALYKTYSESFGSPAIGALLHLTQVLDLGK
jgi:hypothetical protein